MNIEAKNAFIRGALITSLATGSCAVINGVEQFLLTEGRERGVVYPFEQSATEYFHTHMKELEKNTWEEQVHEFSKFSRVVFFPDLPLSSEISFIMLRATKKMTLQSSQLVYERVRNSNDILAPATSVFPELSVRTANSFESIGVSISSNLFPVSVQDLKNEFLEAGIDTSYFTNFPEVMYCRASYYIDYNAPNSLRNSNLMNRTASYACFLDNKPYEMLLGFSSFSIVPPSGGNEYNVYEYAYAYTHEQSQAAMNQPLKFLTGTTELKQFFEERSPEWMK
jgi:hypothetical protein